MSAVGADEGERLRQPPSPARRGSVVNVTFTMIICLVVGSQLVCIVAGQTRRNAGGSGRNRRTTSTTTTTTIAPEDDYDVDDVAQTSILGRIEDDGQVSVFEQAIRDNPVGGRGS